MEKVERKEEIIVESPQPRLDAFLVQQRPEMTRSQIRKQIQQGAITRDGKACKAGDQLRVGDAICWRLPEYGPEPQLKPRALDLKIVFEDESLLVIDKPAGMVVHPGAGTKAPTMVEGLLYHLGKTAPLDISEHGERPGIVHRLDKETSGLLVCAKDVRTHHALSLQFANKTSLREYIALLWGNVKQDTVEIASYLGRDAHDRKRFCSLDEEAYTALPEAKRGHWRHALTGMQVRRRFLHEDGDITLADFRLKTGRTHQIRVHARSIGHPVVGDAVYGFRKQVNKIIDPPTRQMLHARFLGFTHPRTGKKIAFESDLPEDFAEILKNLSRLK